MNMSSENSGISFRQGENYGPNASNFTNFVITNVSGSLSGACLSASDSSVFLGNWSVKNFYSGCISATTSNATITNFTMDNYEYSSLYIMTDNSQQVGSGLFLNGGYNFTISDIAIRGNKNVTSQGAAIDVENSTYLYLENTWLEDNEAEIGGGMYIGFMPVFLNNVTFKSNAAKQGGGLYAEGLLDDNAAFASSFTELTFIQNQASLTGGAVHFENLTSISLNESQFQINVGVKSDNTSSFDYSSKGGAIYYSCKSENCTADINSNVFSSNTADIGGAIYFNDNLFVPKNSSFTGNSATSQGEYGPVFGSYPVHLLLSKDIQNGTNISLEFFVGNNIAISPENYKTELFIDPNNFVNYNADISNTLNTGIKLQLFNQTGGQSFTQNITFYAIDHFGQQITVDYPNFDITLSQENSLNSATLQSLNGAFTLNEGFSSPPGGSLALNISTNIFDSLSINDSFFNRTNYTIEVYFRKCVIGEILPSNLNVCSICPSNTFSLSEPSNSSVACGSCNTLTGAMCEKGGAMLTVSPGYWRYDTLSTRVFSCSNEEACKPATPNTSDCSDKYSDLASSNIFVTCSNIGESDSINSSYSNCSSATLVAVSAYCD